MRNTEARGAGSVAADTATEYWQQPYIASGAAAIAAAVSE